MALTKREEDKILYKLDRADEDQQRRFMDKMRAFEVADRVFEKLKNENSGGCRFCDRSEPVIKYGRAANGKQRYRCKDCNVTFIKNYDLPFYNSEYSEEIWKQYFSEMLRQKPLSELSETFDISIHTALRWRHRILRMLRKLESNQFLAGRVWIDETELNNCRPGLNYDKLREQNQTEKIPQGRSSILAARDYKGRTVMRPVANNSTARADELGYMLDRHVIYESSTIVTDNGTNVGKYCRDRDLSHDSYESKSEKLGIIDWLHSHFKNWVRTFRGVAEYNIDNYCAWFTFLKNNEELKPLAP